MTADSLRGTSISGTVLARVGLLAFGLIGSIASARTLGPVGRGQYFAVTTAATIMAQAANLGLSSSNVFLGAQDPARIRPLLANSFVLALTLAALSALVVAGWGDRASAFIGVPPGMLWAVGAIGAATLLWTLEANLLVATERFLAFNVWQISHGLMALLAIIVCAALDASAGGFVFASAATAVATAVGLTWFIAASASGAMRCSFPLIRSGVGFASRAYLALLLGYLLQRSAASLLVAAGKTSELGQFSIASQLFDALLIVPSSVSLVLYPLLVRHAEDLWHQVRRTAIITTGSMVALCALTALAAPVAVPLVFGTRFSGSIAPLWGLLPTVIAYSLVSVLSQYLVARRFPWSLVAAWGAGLAVALITGIRLTRVYGAVGAALSESCGAALVCVLVVAIAYRSLRLRESPP